MATKADKQLELLRSSIMNSSGVEEKVEGNKLLIVNIRSEKQVLMTFPQLINDT